MMYILNTAESEKALCGFLLLFRAFVGKTLIFPGP